MLSFFSYFFSLKKIKWRIKLLRDRQGSAFQSVYRFTKKSFPHDKSLQKIVIIPIKP